MYYKIIIYLTTKNDATKVSTLGIPAGVNPVDVQ